MTDQLLRIADLFSPKIREALLQSYREFLRRVTEAEVVASFKRNGLYGLIELAASLEGDISKNVAPLLYDAWIKSGRMVIDILPPGSTIGFVSFSTLPVGAVSAAEAFRASLVTGIAETTRETITTAVSLNIAAGNNPIKTARDFRAAIGLTTPQWNAVQNYRNLLETLDPEALNRVLRDSRSDSTVGGAIESGTPLSEERIDWLTERYRQRALKQRAEMIARTESLRAVHMGEYESILAAHMEGKISPNLRRFWIVSADERVRKYHAPIPAMNEAGVRIDESFDTPLGPLRYPLDPEGDAANVINCRCRVRYRIIR